MATPSSELTSRTRMMGQAALERRGVYVARQPAWVIVCERCDWQAEHWDKYSALRAANNHAEGCSGAT